MLMNTPNEPPYRSPIMRSTQEKVPSRPSTASEKDLHNVFVVDTPTGDSSKEKVLVKPVAIKRTFSSKAASNRSSRGSLTSTDKNLQDGGDASDKRPVGTFSLGNLSFKNIKYKAQKLFLEESDDEVDNNQMKSFNDTFGKTDEIQENLDSNRK